MTEGSTLASGERENAVIGSALWAAAGDAIGWMTELGDEGTVRHRTGSPTVSQTVGWRRRIGGRFGPTVDLPAGTYSDDTQLRLAVCRATGPNGMFDPEVFAKVELPVWSCYSLGAGRGTSAAAANLAKTSVNWFNNFFGSDDGRNYITAGGNGAAMRIQPHVWKADPASPDTFLPDVIRDAVITHGHPKGIGGAVFHALCLAYAFVERKSPGPNEWRTFIQQLEYCEGIIKSDDKLGLFWLQAWENKAGRTLAQAFDEEISFAHEAIESILPIVDDPSRYDHVLTLLGGFDEATKGAGTTTAISAAVVANYVGRVSEEQALLVAANTLQSDTDTIASMAGAIFGAFTKQELRWDLQDREYIVREAKRMAQISQQQRTGGFNYPDLLSWTPPSTQSDGVGVLEGKLFLAGLGELLRLGEEYDTNDAIWQWASLPFGQTVLVKRRREPRRLSFADAPHSTSSPSAEASQPDFFAKAPRLETSRARPTVERPREPNIEKLDLDSLTSIAIDSGFDPTLLGRILVALANRRDGIEMSIAFSAIIAKAINSRRRRNS
ncbi:ADP-ribosylglycohydrolase family protein [Rhizobium leguminosarum]|uniref:ADP-ribosylglycohydrolase family protein n=1 Tax=Rhizobium leguminosarum TaxID=384 RepID=UPI003F96B277